MPLKPERAALRALMGPGAFLRRDLKRRALFVSDISRKLDPEGLAALTQRLSQAGWHSDTDQGLLLMDLSFSGYQQVFRRLADSQPREDSHGLARIFARHAAAFTPDMLPEARLALLRYDAGDTLALIRQAASALALSLRQKAPVPGFFIPLLTGLTPREDPS